MLSRALVFEVRRLLVAGELSQRQIARQTGVSRGMVHAIANGRRTARFAEEKRPDDPTPDILSLPERCPVCGYRVYLPCQICRARRYVARGGMTRRLARSA